MPRRKRVVVPRGPAFVPCEACNGTGWILTVTWRWESYNRRVKRCACWREHQRRLTSIMAGEFDARMAQVGSE